MAVRKLTTLTYVRTINNTIFDSDSSIFEPDPKTQYYNIIELGYIIVFSDHRQDEMTTIGCKWC